MLRGILSFSVMTLLSRVFGLVRDVSFSHAFGANWMTDAFWVAFRIPNFMRRLFAEGSFSTAFIPILTEVKETRPHADLKNLVSRTAGTLGAVLLLITALGMLFSPQIATMFSDGANSEPGELSLIAQLLRVTFPFLLFVSLTALASGALNSFHRFGLPALTPVILNLCMIAGALRGSRHFHPPVMAMGWAILVAGILQLLFLLPQIASLDLLALPKWGWNHPDVRKVAKLMLPTLLGSSVAQLNLLFDTFVATRLVHGSQTWLSQADRFLELPLGVFGIALGTVILPALSRHHINTDRAAFSRSLDWGLRATLIIILPAATGLMLLSTPLVATVFQHGKFTAHDTCMTAISVFGLSFGLPAFALVKTLLPAFYARQDTATPARAGIVALVANMLLNVLLLWALYAIGFAADQRAGHGFMEAMAHRPGMHIALGIASALSSYMNLCLLWHFLRRSRIYDPQPDWARFVTRSVIANALMAAFIIAMRQQGPDFLVASAAVKILWLAGIVVGGAVVYGAVMLSLGFRTRDLGKH
ncbi:murein biosynthesis integral membrane protein MurJ [Lysobacter rhizosphaerae]